MQKESELIQVISSACVTPYGELLVEFMDKYNLPNLKEASVEQLEEFIESRMVVMI